MVRCGESLSLFDLEGQLIRCEFGVLWVTEDGERDDITLVGGQAARLKRGQTVVSGVQESVVSLIRT